MLFKIIIKVVLILVINKKKTFMACNHYCQLSNFISSYQDISMPYRKCIVYKVACCRAIPLTQGIESTVEESADSCIAYISNLKMSGISLPMIQVRLA